MTTSVERRAARILFSLYLLEAAVLLVLLGSYGARAEDSPAIGTTVGALLTAGAAGVLASAWLLASQVAASGPQRRRAVAVALGTNLLTVLAGMLLLEAAVRLAARRTPAGIVVGGVALRPTWSELTARSRQVLAAVAPWGTWDASYFIYDRELGWTVGPSRRSPDGLYFSSVEGIRSAGPGVKMGERSSRFRVALVGDSFAFSFEVPFEESWGYHLAHLLGEDAQVLNFGVDGYGIDQMYLRYQRDVRPWRPQAVLIGLSGHDLRRTMAVYPFVSFGWPGYIVKPRFTVEGEGLRLLNVPLPTPDEVLAKGSLRELPFAEHDPAYRIADSHWPLERSSLFVRFLASALPRPEAPWVTEEATRDLNGRLLARMVRSIDQDGAVPLVVLMFYRDALVPETLAGARVSFLDMTECVSGVPAGRRQVPGGHYTGLANQAVARCTASALQAALRRPAVSGRRAPPRDGR